MGVKSGKIGRTDESVDGGGLWIGTERGLAPAYIPTYGDPGSEGIGRPIGYTQI